MSGLIALPLSSAIPATLEPTVEKARDYIDASKSAATRRAYPADLADFDRYSATAPSTVSRRCPPPRQPSCST